jgi:hypothetical protein
MSTMSAEKSPGLEAAAEASSGDESSVANFMNLLEQHKRKCESAGKYLEADIAKQRLDELRAHEEHRREETLRSRQVAQRLGVEEAHMFEFGQFNQMWDQTMSE